MSEMCKHGWPSGVSNPCPDCEIEKLKTRIEDLKDALCNIRNCLGPAVPWHDCRCPHCQGFQEEMQQALEYVYGVLGSGLGYVYLAKGLPKPQEEPRKHITTEVEGLRARVEKLEMGHPWPGVAPCGHNITSTAPVCRECLENERVVAATAKRTATHYAEQIHRLQTARAKVRVEGYETEKRHHNAISNAHEALNTLRRKNHEHVCQLRQIAGMCGAPDAADACRNILAVIKESEVKA